MINKLYQRKQFKHPIYIEPRILYEDEIFLPIPKLFYKGIISGYIISNYGRIYDTVNNRFINHFVNKYGFDKVLLNFIRYGKLVSIELPVDWIVKLTFDYQGFNQFDGYTIKYLDRDPQNLYINNLIYIYPGVGKGNSYTQRKHERY